MNHPAAVRAFTGRHMLVWMVGFFGVVILVNIIMARFAISTFGGTVVDNSYVASQQFNGWLAQARAQEKLGWTSQISLDARRRPVLVIRDATGGAAGFAASGTAHHPLGRAPDKVLAFASAADGRLVSATSLPAGRWLVRLKVTGPGASIRLRETVQ